MADTGRRQSQRDDSSGSKVADLSDFPLRAQESRSGETRELRHSISSMISTESLREIFIANASDGSDSASTPRAPTHSISISNPTTSRPENPPVNPSTSSSRKASGKENTKPYITGSTPSQDSELYQRRLVQRESSRNRTSGSMPRLITMAGRPSQSERPHKSPNTIVSSTVESWTQSLIGCSDSNVFSHTTVTSDRTSIRSSSPKKPKIASKKLEPNRASERSSPATTEQNWIGDSAVWRPGTSQEIPRLPTRKHSGTLEGLNYKSQGKTYLQEWRENYMNKQSTPTSLVKSIIEYHDEQDRKLQKIIYSLVSKKPPATPKSLDREISKIKSAIAVAHNANLNYQTTIHELKNQLEGARAVTAKLEADLIEQKKLVERFSNKVKKRKAEDLQNSEFRQAQVLLNSESQKSKSREEDNLRQSMSRRMLALGQDTTQSPVTKVSVMEVEAPQIAVTDMKTPASAIFGGGVRHVETYHQHNINTVGMNLCLMEMEELYSVDSYRPATVAAESALEYAKKQDNDKILAETYAWTGVCYHRTNDIKSAMSCFKMALDIAQGLKQDEGMLDWFSTISAWLQDLEKFERRWT